MAKLHDTVITIRMPRHLAAEVYQYAEQRGLMTKDKQPNLAAAIRELAAAGLSTGNTEKIARAAYDNARADLLQEVNEHLKAFIRTLSEGL